MGGGPYVLKEKFKDKLKIWNKEHFGDLQRRRRIIEYEMIKEVCFEGKRILTTPIVECCYV